MIDALRVRVCKLLGCCLTLLIGYDGPCTKYVVIHAGAEMDLGKMDWSLDDDDRAKRGGDQARNGFHDTIR